MPNSPSKAEQIAEAAARNGNKDTPRAREVPAEPVSDPSGPDDVVVAAPVAEPRGKAPPIDPDAAKAPVLGKSSRDDIASRFRSQRTAHENDIDAEMLEFNHTGMPAELTEQVSQVPVGEEDEETPVVAAQEEEEELEPGEGEEVVYILNVRGKKIEVTQEQLEALAEKVDGPGTVAERAQKAAAGDDYLKEARATLDDAKRIRDEILTLRGSQPAKHPGAQDATHTAEHVPAAGETVEHPDDPFAKAVEAITFGQPEEAVRLLREAVTTTTATQAKGVSEDAITEQQMRLQADRAARIGKAFEDANPELAKDEFSRVAIIDRCVRLQHEDLVALCSELAIDPAKVPKDPATIQHWHKFYRAKAFNVRDPEVLLNKAKDDFLEWRGGGKAPQAEPARGKPRVEITVDRRIRRASIQQQPSRTVTPKPDARTQQPAPRDRAAIVAEMKQQRITPRTPPAAVRPKRAAS